MTEINLMGYTIQVTTPWGKPGEELCHLSWTDKDKSFSDFETLNVIGEHMVKCRPVQAENLLNLMKEISK